MITLAESFADCDYVVTLTLRKYGFSDLLLFILPPFLFHCSRAAIDCPLNKTINSEVKILRFVHRNGYSRSSCVTRHK